MASQKYNILYGRLSQEDERQRDDRQKESNSIHNQKLFLNSTQRIMDLKTRCSWRTMATPVQTLTVRPGRRL